MLKRTVSGMMLVLLLVGMLTLLFNIQPVKQAESTDYEPISANGYVNVDVSEAKQMIESNPDLVILDVRTSGEYDSGHIENAVLIPVTELEDRIDELDKEKDTLVYCRTGGRSATASQILVDNGFSSVYNMLGGITAWRNAGYWIEIIHGGDLIIDGTQTLTIENCTYIVIGGIHVEDSGKLLTRNVILMIEQDYHYQHSLYVRDFGELRMENTTLDSNLELEVRMTGHAQGDIINSTIEEYAWVDCADDSTLNISSSTLIEIGARDQSRLVISDSEILWVLNLWFLLPSQVVCLEDLKPGFFKYWDLHENQSAFNVLYDLTLENTFVGSWSIIIDHAAHTSVTLLNSTIGVVSCGFSGEEVIVDGANLCFHRNWTLAKLTLLNSSVTGKWRFGLTNCAAEISNTTANLFLHECTNVSIRNSAVELDAYYFMNGVVQFQEGIIDFIGTVYSSFYICGEIDFPPELNISGAIASSNITRNYGIVVVNGTGDPVSDTELNLCDENGTSVWNGATDSFGKANFNVTFSDSNYTDILSLEAVEGALSATMNVIFLSDTPLILTLLTHDIVISNVTSSKTIVGQGYCISINVTVKNQGDVPENFNLTVYANTTTVETETINNIANGTSTILTFTWNTTDWAKGNYTITAYAHPVPHEADIADNRYINGWVTVATVGDITGPEGYPDGKRDMRDVALVARKFGKKYPDPEYDPNCDLTGCIPGVQDGKIDMRDVAVVARHFGEADP